VKDGEKGDLSAEIFIITGETLRRLGDRLEQERIKRFFVPERESVELPGNGKDDVEIVHGQKIPRPALDPSCPPQRLAFGTMPVSAGVAGNMLVIAMPASLKKRF
jgi:hypothetical protein